MSPTLKLFLIYATLVTCPSVQAFADGGAKWPAYPLRGANIVTSISETDLWKLADWKVNSVRLLHLGLISDKAPYQTDAKELEATFKVIDLSLKLGFYTILCPGASMDNHDAFFSNKEFRTAFKELWKGIAHRYKDDKRGIAYDLFNEPHDALASKEWPGYARELTQAIREIDPVHTLIVEPAAWAWPDGFKDFRPTGDKNTVYSFHFYAPMDFTHLRGRDAKGGFTGMLNATEEQRQERKYPGLLEGELWNKAKLKKSISSALKFRNRYHVKIWCGEFGTCRWAIGAKQWYQDMIETMESEKVGWSYYSFREWHAMDIEMAPNVVNQPTPRDETEMTKLFKSYFVKDQTPPK